MNVVLTLQLSLLDKRHSILMYGTRRSAVMQKCLLQVTGTVLYCQALLLHDAQRTAAVASAQLDVYEGKQGLLTVRLQLNSLGCILVRLQAVKHAHVGSLISLITWAAQAW